MTKARDLANIISGSGTLNSFENVIPNLDASKITTGTFADARISNLVFHNTQHHLMITNLLMIFLHLLRQASNENKVGYNTNSMSIDVFQHNSKIGTTTNAGHSFREYVGSIFESEAASPTLFDWSFN